MFVHIKFKPDPIVRQSSGRAMLKGVFGQTPEAKALMRRHPHRLIRAFRYPLTESLDTTKCRKGEQNLVCDFAQAQDAHVRWHLFAWLGPFVSVFWLLDFYRYIWALTNYSSANVLGDSFLRCCLIWQKNSLFGTVWFFACQLSGICLIAWFYEIFFDYLLIRDTVCFLAYQR